MQLRWDVAIFNSGQMVMADSESDPLERWRLHCSYFPPALATWQRNTCASRPQAHLQVCIQHVGQYCHMQQGVTKTGKCWQAVPCKELGCFVSFGCIALFLYCYSANFSLVVYCSFQDLMLIRARTYFKNMLHALVFSVQFSVILYKEFSPTKGNRTTSQGLQRQRRTPFWG